MESRRLDREITIDGQFRDWDGALKFVEQAELSVGLMNDNHHLYIALVVGDREVRRQIMMSGLYLWFDPDATENRQFGIRYPIGVVEGTDDLMSLLKERDPTKMVEAFDKASSEVMVIGREDRIWRRGRVDEFDGIVVAAEAGKDALVIEFKIPLAETARFGYGIGSTEGDLIGIGLESPEVDMEKMRDEIQKTMSEGGGRPSGGGGRGGGMPGGGKSGGGRGGGMRPSGGGDRPEPPEPIKLWTQVVLASQ